MKKPYQLSIFLVTFFCFFSCNDTPPNNVMNQYGWTAKDRANLIRICMNSFRDHPNAKAICNCILEKQMKNQSPSEKPDVKLVLECQNAR